MTSTETRHAARSFIPRRDFTARRLQAASEPVTRTRQERRAAMEARRRDAQPGEGLLP
jgi:hypothetical protein